MIWLTRLPEDGAPRARKTLLHKAAWALLSYALRERGAPALSEERLSFGPHGKPYLKGGPCFSLSHTKGLALCTLEDWETGADAERRRAFSPSLQKRVFTPGEQSMANAAADPEALFTTLWTLKESYMKYTGRGLSQGANTLSFQFYGGRPVLAEDPAFFCTTVWEGCHISQCGPAPFEMALRPVDFRALGLAANEKKN